MGYPFFKFKVGEPSRMVTSVEEEVALGLDWYDTMAEAQAAVLEPPEPSGWPKLMRKDDRIFSVFDDDQEAKARALGFTLGV